MVQEGAGRSLNDDLLTAAADVQAVEGLDRRVGLALSGPECREVMLTHKHLGGRVHRIAVEPNGDVPDAMTGHRGGRRTIDDTVVVVSASSRKACVKVRPNLRGSEDPSSSIFLFFSAAASSSTTSIAHDVHRVVALAPRR